jgi:hypothetical protein
LFFICFDNSIYKKENKINENINFIKRIFQNEEASGIGILKEIKIKLY